jgi:DNA-binding NtrC family response regulator
MGDVLTVESLLDEALLSSTILQSTNQKKPTILLAIIDDRTLRMSQSTLESIGYRVFVASDSSQVFHVLQTTIDIGLALIDDRLPLANGMAIAKQIYDQGFRCPVVILTRKLNFWSQWRARKNGVAELATYFVTPEQSLSIAETYLPLT